MKKNVLFLALLLFAISLPAQQTIYVSAEGKQNIGFSESSPGNSLINALLLAKSGSVKKIIVIGTIDYNTDYLSGEFIKNNGAVFGLSNPSGSVGDSQEILITGKLEASGTQKAVLSGRNSGASVLAFSDNIRVRFEHIEISGGEKSEKTTGAGLLVVGKSVITLGTGAIVRANQRFGVGVIAGGTVILDGGVVQDNQDSGFFVNKDGNLILKNGIIRNNKLPNNGGGVFIAKGGNFTMSGGSITGNSSLFGGGVTISEGGGFTMSGGSITGNTAVGGGGIYVNKGGRFVQTGGNVSNNTAKTNPDIFRE